MANGLFCSESLPSTPKLRHVSNDSNSENTPPELLNVLGKTCDLTCNEVLDEREILRELPNPVQEKPPQQLGNTNFCPVKSKIDSYLLKDDRILQNLLRNEERYMPSVPDYFKFVQTELKPHMRELVVDWMFNVFKDVEVKHQLSPEVFILAVNFMDRFLSVCCIKVNQFQLLGASCLFLASKFKAIQHLSSETLVMYTDYSINSSELMEWELLILQKLRWELSSITAMDYLDHVLPRLCLPRAIDTCKLRTMVDTVICYSALDYFWTYQPASLFAAASILFSLQYSVTQSTSETDFNNQELEALERITCETRRCLQILTHVSGEDLDTCVSMLTRTMPQHLAQVEKPPQPEIRPESPFRSPDTTINIDTTCIPRDVDTPTSSTPSPSSGYYSSAVDIFSDESSSTSTFNHQAGQPFITSVVDVFTDFNTSVLEASLSPSESYGSVLHNL